MTWCREAIGSGGCDPNRCMYVCGCVDVCMYVYVYVCMYVWLVIAAGCGIQLNKVHWAGGRCGAAPQALESGASQAPICLVTLLP